MVNPYSGEVFECRTCGQKIRWDREDRIFKNVETRQFNEIGLRHQDANRQERYKRTPREHIPAENIPCNRCGYNYDTTFWFQCPKCFRLCCQVCGHIFEWRGDQRNCPKCKAMRADKIMMTKMSAERYIPRTQSEIIQDVQIIMSRYNCHD